MRITAARSLRDRVYFFGPIAGARPRSPPQGRGAKIYREGGLTISSKRYRSAPRRAVERFGHDGRSRRRGRGLLEAENFSESREFGFGQHPSLADPLGPELTFNDGSISP